MTSKILHVHGADAKQLNVVFSSLLYFVGNAVYDAFEGQNDFGVTKICLKFIPTKMFVFRRLWRMTENGRLKLFL